MTARDAAIAREEAREAAIVDARELAQAEAKCAALRAYAEMTEEQRSVVAFGMIPLEIQLEYQDRVLDDDGPRLFSIALLRVAEDLGRLFV